MIKVIVFDLDNTLYWMGKFDRPEVRDDDEEYKEFLRTVRLSDENREILNKLREKYTLFIINYEPSVWRFEAKKQAFELEAHFDKIWRAHEGKGKLDIFKEIIKEFKPHEILSIGDKRHNEIRAANLLGCHSVQIMIGRHANKDPEDEYEIPHFQIHSLSGIFDILDKLNKESSK